MEKRDLVGLQLFKLERERFEVDFNLQKLIASSSSLELILVYLDWVLSLFLCALRWNASAWNAS